MTTARKVLANGKKPAPVPGRNLRTGKARSSANARRHRSSLDNVICSMGVKVAFVMLR
jgi:hypothetical protein